VPATPPTLAPDVTRRGEPGRGAGEEATVDPRFDVMAFGLSTVRRATVLFLGFALVVGRRAEVVRRFGADFGLELGVLGLRGDRLGGRLGFLGGGRPLPGERPPPPPQPASQGLACQKSEAVITASTSANLNALLLCTNFPLLLSDYSHLALLSS